MVCSEHPELDAKPLPGGEFRRSRARPEAAVPIPGAGRCVTAQPCPQQPSHAGSAVAEPEMDGVSSNRNMSYSRWSYNRYPLSGLGLLFSCFSFLFFLPDIVKPSRCLYKSRWGALFREAKPFSNAASPVLGHPVFAVTPAVAFDDV